MNMKELLDELKKLDSDLKIKGLDSDLEVFLVDDIFGTTYEAIAISIGEVYDNDEGDITRLSPGTTVLVINFES